MRQNYGVQNYGVQDAATTLSQTISDFPPSRHHEVLVFDKLTIMAPLCTMLPSHYRADAALWHG